MLSVAEASARILAEIRALPPERVGLMESLGRVIAQDVRSPVTLPPWNNSAMDGYAVRADDVIGASAAAPVSLTVIDSVAAGSFPARAVGRGEATRIMTGAPVPEGADSVIRVEDTDGGEARVLVRDARDAGRNVRPRGEDIIEGATAVRAGTPLGAAHLGLLASVGASSVEVYGRPRVAIVGSGDELVELDRFEEALAGRRIVSSNSYTLAALVRQAGGEPVSLGVAADTHASLRALVERAAGCDLLVTTAGVSVGALDYTREVLEALGAELRFWKVRMRPGAPLAFGMLGGMPWIGLSGNPVSAMITFELFVRPAIRRMLGHSRLFRRPVSVILEETVTTGAPLTHFLRAIVRLDSDGRARARLTGAQSSGMLTSMTLANALIVVPADRQRVERGETLNALPLGDEYAMTAELGL